MISRRWPDWFDWDLEFGPHILKRMLDRSFSEVDVRRMLADATGYRKDMVVGRWVVETSQERHPWEVVVEPDHAATLLVVVTAYRAD